MRGRKKMEETPKNNSEQPAQLAPDMQSLANLAGQMGNVGEEAEKEHNQKVGEVYGEIAKNALVKRNGMSEEEATEKVANSTFDELEGMIGASGSIKTACESIADRLHLSATESELLDAVLHGDNDEIFEEAEEDVDFINGAFVDSGEESLENKERYILDILSDIHDNWCAENEAKFFDGYRAEKRYQFLKLETIGFDEATSDLLFVEPILKKIGIDIDIENLEEQYNSYPYPINSDHLGILDDFSYTGGDDGSTPMGALFAEKLQNNPSEFLSDGASEKIKNIIQSSYNDAIAITEQVGKHRMGEEVDGRAIFAYMLGGEE